MPLEGHWERQHTPLRDTRRRELRVLVAVAAVLLVAGVVVLVVAITGDSPKKPSAGCIETTVPSTLGGATVRACGRDARRLCRQQAPLHDPTALRIQARCRELGYL